MFAKDKISQSMIDAVNSVIENSDIKELSILSENLLESEKGQKLKATISSFDRMMRNAKVNTHMVADKGSKKQYVDGLDGIRREVPAGTGDNHHFSVKVKLSAESTNQGLDEVLDTPSATKSYLDKSATKRKELAATGKLGDDSHRKINKSFAGTNKVLSREDLSFSKKILEAMKPVSTPDFSDVDEETMTPAQTKKKEENVLSMKSKEKDFKKKYGKNWKNVMYATATKMAMAESVDDVSEDLQETSTELLARYKTKASKSASDADKQGDFSKGDKRFSGIIKATKKQFKNAATKESVDEGKTPIDDNVPFITSESGVTRNVNRIKAIAKKHKAKMDL